MSDDKPMTAREKHMFVASILVIFFFATLIASLGWMGAAAFYQHREEIFAAITAAPLPTVACVSAVGLGLSIIYGMSKVY